VETRQKVCGRWVRANEGVGEKCRQEQALWGANGVVAGERITPLAQRASSRMRVACEGCLSALPRGAAPRFGQAPQEQSN